MEKNQFNLFPQNVQKLFPFFTLEPQEEHIDSLSNLFPQFMQKESSFLTLAPHEGHLSSSKLNPQDMQNLALESTCLLQLGQVL